MKTGGFLYIIYEVMQNQVCIWMAATGLDIKMECEVKASKQLKKNCMLSCLS